ncbi:hypothetical protein Cgig2_028047 [Carnegiea gigantea]|uniref:Uncharacterized protein n=1 Tax=Carnegiea gigantea TaxID=171969 RepID=A0A9Q1JSH5_9CARY|nr:hypothetical protein Cgig2_028047 [Carnegiea gigantea]
MVFNILNIRLEVALLEDGIGSLGHQEFLKEFCTILMSLPVTLMLGLGRSPFSVSKASFSFFSFSQRRLYLIAESSDFRCSIWWSWIHLSSTETDGRPGKGLVNKSAGLAKERKSDEEERSRERLGLILAMATCSSGTFNGSSQPVGAKAHDFIRPSTKVYLAGRSAPKKSTAQAWVFTRGSRTACWVTSRLSQELPAAGNPSASLEAECPPDHRCGDNPSIPIPLEGGGSILKGEGAEVAAMSYPSSALGRFRVSIRGRLRDTVGGLQPCGANFGTCKKGVVLKNKESSGGKEKVVLEAQQFGKPIERLPIAQKCLPTKIEEVEDEVEDGVEGEYEDTHDPFKD